MKSFWFISRDESLGLIYEWNIVRIDSTMDASEALAWRKSKPDFLKLSKISMDIYWKTKTYTLPIEYKESTNISKIDDITIDLKKYIAKYCTMRLMSDWLKGIWDKFLMDYMCVHIVYNDGRSFVCFMDRDKPLDDQVQTTEDDKWKQIMLKEYMDWYCRITPYVFKVWAAKHDLSISENYDVWDRMIWGNYTAKLREAMFSNATKTLPSGRLLMAWQYDVIRKMGKKTMLIAPRRWGKSFLLWLLALREILRDSFTIHGSFRPISVIYIGLTKTKLMKVVNYIKTMLNKCWIREEDNMFHRDAVNMNLSFRSGKLVIGEISFVSAESSDPGIGDYADLIIADECWKLRKEIYEGIQPIIDTEWARFIWATTLYKNSMKWWAYEKLVEWETDTKMDYDTFIEENWLNFVGIDLSTKEWQNLYCEAVEEFAYKNQTVGLRYTIDDVEYLTARQKEVVKKNTAKDPVRYMAELYSRYADEWKAFRYEPCLVQKDKVNTPSYQDIVVAYDPAATADQPGLIVWWYDPNREKIVALEEYYLEKTWRYEDHYYSIVEVLKSAKKYLINPEKNRIFFAMDWTQKGTAEALQIKWLIIHLRIVYTAGVNIAISKLIQNEQTVPKNLLVEMSQLLIDWWKMEINMDLKKLILEMDYFQPMLTKTEKLTFRWLGSPDDLVNAMIIMNYYFYNILGLKYDMMKLEEKPVANMTKKEMWEYHKKQRIEKERKRLDLESSTRNQVYFRNHVY